MRKLLLTLGLIITNILFYGQVSDLSLSFKEVAPDIYEGIKIYSEDKWVTDYEMIVYTIDNQVEAYINISKEALNENYDSELMTSSLKEWVININGKYYFDYEMVIYTYKNQFKAKNSY